MPLEEGADLDRIRGNSGNRRVGRQDGPAPRGGQLAHRNLVLCRPVAGEAGAVRREEPARATVPPGACGGANLGELLTGYQPGRIDEIASRQMEIDEGKVEISVGMQRRCREANFDLVFQVDAGGAFDLIEPEVVGAERCAGPIVAARVMERHVGLELARPREDVGLVDSVFDEPSELGVARTPAARLSHMGKSNSPPPPCPLLQAPQGGGIRSNFGGPCTLLMTDAYSGAGGSAAGRPAEQLWRRVGECPEAGAGGESLSARGSVYLRGPDRWAGREGVRIAAAGQEPHG